MEASVGTSPPPPTVSGCPFWSSPSPLPAPQAARASVTIAIPPRTRAVCLILELRLLERSYISANLAGCAVGGGSAEVINIAMNVEVKIIREESRHVGWGQCGPWRCHGRVREIRSKAVHVRLEIGESKDDGPVAAGPRGTGVDMRCVRVAHSVRDIRDQDGTGCRVHYHRTLARRGRRAGGNFLHVVERHSSG